MKLARKFTLAIALAVVAVMAGHAYLLMRQEVTLFDADLEQTSHLKRLLRRSIEGVWRAYGEDAAGHMVEEAALGIEGVTLRWLRLDAPPGDPRHLDLSSDRRAALERGETVRFVADNDAGEPWRYTYVPIAVDGARFAVLAAAESLRQQHAFVVTTNLQIILTALLVIAICTGAIYLVGLRFIGRPVRLLRDRARALGAGEFGPPLALRQHDEIGELAEELDAMADHLRAAQQRLAEETEARTAALEQMRHTDRLTTMGQLASGVAHELGTPLAVITGRAEMIVSGEAEGERVAGCARVIVEQAGRMAAGIRQLLDFSRRQGPRFGLASVRVIAARTVELLAGFARKRGATLELQASQDPELLAVDESQIQQALTNVVMNALQATPAGGHVVIAVERRQAAPRGSDPARECVCLTVSDDGPGIASADMPRLFEPFFTTKGIGEGTGLGLSVANGIVQEHGGWIEVESALGKGSRFTIALPRDVEAHVRSTEVAS